MKAIKPLKLAEGTVLLTHPWDDLIGKKVSVSAAASFLNKEQGTSASTRGPRLWLDGMDGWPDELDGNAPVQLTGRLTKVVDLPVFRYEVGQAFKEGLPVPEGYSLEKAATRYVLMEPTWKIIEKE